MSGSNFEEGISRARSRETDNQKSAGARSGTKVKTTKLPRGTKSNPTKGGGINRKPNA